MDGVSSHSAAQLREFKHARYAREAEERREKERRELKEAVREVARNLIEISQIMAAAPKASAPTNVSAPMPTHAPASFATSTSQEPAASEGSCVMYTRIEGPHGPRWLLGRHF
jgi:hypothetical protein